MQPLRRGLCVESSEACVKRTTDQTTTGDGADNDGYTALHVAANYM